MSCFLYRHFNKDNCLLYVGISLSAVNRLSQHRDASHWFAEIATVKIEVFKDRKEALGAEREAIIKERPRHNLKIPSIRDTKAARVARTDESRADLVRRIAQFNPAYTLKDAADVLQVSGATIKRFIDAGEIGFIQIGNRIRITGWQMIDFLEAAAARSASTHNSTHKPEPDYSKPLRSMAESASAINA